MKLKVDIDSGNAGVSAREDVIRILDSISLKIRKGFDNGGILDVNGNTVGKWSIDDSNDDECDEG